MHNFKDNLLRVKSPVKTTVCTLMKRMTGNGRICPSTKERVEQISVQSLVPELFSQHPTIFRSPPQIPHCSILISKRPEGVTATFKRCF